LIERRFGIELKINAEAISRNGGAEHVVGIVKPLGFDQP
jgi:hypothetical protein